MKRFKILRRYINLKLGLDKEEEEQLTYLEIKEGAKFSGFNFWILSFAMLIACIGLNTNNTSAVIGAMLISPLMGPIVGLSFGLAVNDSNLKKTGFRNWFLMTIISLISSTLFFIISPFNNNTEVLLSFTNASIFDIFLAFFGGFAGFIGIIKKEGIKVIAGVAVATACMPPLCTAGFGIAHGNAAQFLGGLYFYLINCLFIGLATFLMSRVLGFHTFFKCITSFTKTTQWLWTLFILLMIIPGAYIAYNKYKAEHNNPTTTTTQERRIEQLEQKIKLLDSIVNSTKR